MITQVDDYIWRGPRPPTDTWLAENGFEFSINLESGWFNFSHDLPIYDKNELNYPLSDIFPPHFRTLKFIAATAKIREDAKKQTYIHCLHGEDRTGMVSAAYRILYQGWSVEKATQEAVQLGFHRIPYFWWLWTLRKLK